MHTFHLGIDVAKAKLDCALRLPDGKLRHKSLSNSPAGFSELMNFLSKHQATNAHVCMEATGIYWEALAEFLSEQPGVRVSVLNPFQIKAFANSRLTRTKTDKVDAALIALFCQERRPEPWQAPSPSERALRALVLRLDSLQGMRTQELNRLQVARGNVRDGIAEHIKWLDTQIKQVIEQIRKLFDDDDDLNGKRRLLESIPGLGERTIAVLLAFYAHPERFNNACQAAAVKSRAFLPAQGSVHAGHGGALSHALGTSLPRAPGRRRQAAQAHHRRHDAQARSGRLRRASFGQTLRPHRSRRLTAVTVSTGWAPASAPLLRC